MSQEWLRPADEEWQARVPIPASHPAFTGHFPEDPVFPGVALLDLVLCALRERRSDRLYITTIRSVRWRALVRPGQVLDLNARGPSTDGRLSFEIRNADALVCHGVLVVTEGAG